MSRAMFFKKFTAQTNVWDGYDTSNNAYSSANCLNPTNNINGTSDIYVENATMSSILDEGQYVLKIVANTTAPNFWPYFYNLKRYADYKIAFDVKGVDVNTLRLWIRTVFWNVANENVYLEVNGAWTTIYVSVCSINNSQAIWFYPLKDGAGVINSEFYMRNVRAYRYVANLVPTSRAWSENEGVMLPLFISNGANTISLESVDVFNSNYAVKITTNTTTQYTAAQHVFNVVQGQTYQFTLIAKVINSNYTRLVNRVPWSQYGLTSINLDANNNLGYKTYTWTQTAFATGEAELWLYTSGGSSNINAVVLIDTLMIKPI